MIACADAHTSRSADKKCTGIHAWDTFQKSDVLGGGCTSLDVDTGNLRTLYVFCWLFDLVALFALALLIALLVPGVGDKILGMIPEQFAVARGLLPLALAAFVLFWLALSTIVFSSFHCIAVCNDADTKDCNKECSFIDSSSSNGVKSSSAPTWGWATTCTAAGLMLFATGGLVAQFVLQRKDMSPESTPIYG